MLKEIGQKLRMLVNYRWKLFDDNYFDKAIPSGALFHRFTVNFDTVNQEQASVNRARPRPDAINFARSTMMEPGGSYLWPREKKTTWTLQRDRRREKKRGYVNRHRRQGVACKFIFKRVVREPFFVRRTFCRFSTFHELQQLYRVRWPWLNPSSKFYPNRILRTFSDDLQNYIL